MAETGQTLLSIEDLIFVPRKRANHYPNLPEWVADVPVIRNLLRRGIEIHEHDFYENIESVETKIAAFSKSMKHLHVDKLSHAQAVALGEQLARLITSATEIIELSHILEANHKTGEPVSWKNFELFTNEKTALTIAIVEELRSVLDKAIANPSDDIEISQLPSDVRRLLMRTWGVFAQLKAAFKIIKENYITFTTSAARKL